MVKFTTRNEDSDIDFSIHNLKKIYVVNVSYRKNQKSNNGTPLPLEKIDESIYKNYANCTCFVTTENRVHLWIAALADIVWVEASDTNDIVWRDRTDKTGDKINQT